jgi:hypothetical protein
MYLCNLSPQGKVLFLKRTWTIFLILVITPSDNDLTLVHRVQGHRKLFPLMLCACVRLAANGIRGKFTAVREGWTLRTRGGGGTEILF